MAANSVGYMMRKFNPGILISQGLNARQAIGQFQQALPIAIT